MVDGKGILDALLGAASTGGGQANNGAAGGLGDILGQVLGGAQGQPGQQAGGGLGGLLGQMLGGGGQQAQGGGGLGGLLGQILGGGGAPQAQAGQPSAGGGLGDMLSQVLAGAGGASSGGLIDAVKNVVAKNPGLVQSAAIGAAGLLLGTQAGRGLATSAAKLGGVALIGGLAYHALKNFQAKNDATGTAAAALPAPHEYHPVASTSDGALKLVRAMIAAALADGKIDENEQRRILGEMSQSALSADQSAWLQNEMTKPASAQQLAATASSPQEAVEIYTSARIAIDPDTAPNKAFLASLAAALNLPTPLVVELDQAVDSVKIEAGA